MADTSPTDRELRPHVDGYKKFVGWMKWGTIVSAVVTAFVVWLIA